VALAQGGSCSSAGLSGPVQALSARGATAGSTERFDHMRHSWWETRAEMGTPRAAMGLVAAQGALFAVGGIDASGQPSAAVERFDHLSEV
jgi:hypothetical protein